jgi:hypothetical protein
VGVGYWKDRQIEGEENGFGYSGNQRVCACCQKDESLMRFVESEGEAGICDFCSSSESRIVELRALFVEMSECIRREYVPAYMSGDIPGGDWDFYPPTVPSSDLLIALGDPLGEGELAHAFMEAFWDDWIPVGGMFGTQEDHLRWGWESFVRTIKGSSRFVFLHPAAERFHEIMEISTADMLDQLATVITNCGAIVPLPQGQLIFRGRKHSPTASLISADELGAPPTSLAPGQRMNPPGIPFFYGAHDEATVLAELRGIDGEFATVAGWVTVRDSYIVDLTSLIPVPSLFDRKPYAPRSEMKFLHSFAEEISKPMRAHDNPEVDYVPTQIVAEFIRHCVHPPGSSEPVEGLRYGSAIRDGGVNLVLFADELNKTSLLEILGTPRVYEAVSVATDWKRQ